MLRALEREFAVAEVDSQLAQQMAAYIAITAVIVGVVDYASSRFRKDMGLMERYA